ncbi:MAG TPA: hypothetical protein ENI23_17755 [bacterium]|nr:hypothetical protein [bacterium]
MKTERCTMSCCREAVKREQKRVKDIVEKLENPYPKDIFIEPTKKQYAKFHKILQKDNLTLDKFSGAIGRGIYYAIKEKILKAIEVKDV